ncbi:MAG: DNA adenine methylase [Clostridiales Family XIII bacterium]|jgi:DNA adenine methylase|nr:DNA adenine methylase [Clostridiales Family XIII bacterium]
MSWVGGKKALRDEVLARFPPKYFRYAEVFGGAGWVLFNKPYGLYDTGGFEIFNDMNSNLVNLYQCVRDQPEPLIRELEYTLNSREDFNRIRRDLVHKTNLPDIKRAALYYQLIKQSYGSGLKSFGAVPHSMWASFPMIHLASERLQRVVIENRDFEALIKTYDRPDTFFYLDPPYFSTENYYKGVNFGREDHARLAGVLEGIEGLFLLSYNDCQEIVDLYSRPGITIESLSRLNNLMQRYDGGCEFAELLIANYDMSASAKQYEQIVLFDDSDITRTQQERKIIYHG